MKPSEESPSLTLGLAQPEGKQRFQPKDSEPRLGLSGVVFLTCLCCFVGCVNARQIYKSYELAHSGQGTLATIGSCERVEAIGTRGGILHLVGCQVTYDGHIGRMGSSAYDAGPGQRIPVLYLPSNPSVVLAGDPGDTTWTISVKNYGLFDLLFSVIYCLLFFVVAGFIIGALFLGTLDLFFLKP